MEPKILFCGVCFYDAEMVLDDVNWVNAVYFIV